MWKNSRGCRFGIEKKTGHVPEVGSRLGGYARKLAIRENRTTIILRLDEAAEATPGGFGAAWIADPHDRGRFFDGAGPGKI